MLTYRGTNVLPWIQVQQRPAGMGGSAVYAILGKYSIEYEMNLTERRQKRLAISFIGK